MPEDTSRTFNIGDTIPGGGTVFAASNFGANGLECAPEFLGPVT